MPHPCAKGARWSKPNRAALCAMGLPLGSPSPPRKSVRDDCAMGTSLIAQISSPYFRVSDQSVTRGTRRHMCLFCAALACVCAGRSPLAGTPPRLFSEPKRSQPPVVTSLVQPPHPALSQGPPTPRINPSWADTPTALNAANRLISLLSAFAPVVTPGLPYGF